MRNALSAFLVFAIWIALVLGCVGGRHQASPKSLTEEHRKAIYSALAVKQYPRPVSLEITDGGWLVTTFELTGRAPGGSFEAFGTDAVITVRETMLPFRVTERYRVTVNGPSPATGLIRRYGSARFIEGGGVKWEDGIR